MGSVIVGGARTPIGKLLGAFAGLSATDLGGIAIAGALRRAGLDPEHVDSVVMGQVLQAGCGQIPARQAAVKGGIAMSVDALTVNKVCLSGLNAVALADLMIRAGQADVVIAGGMESMTNAPHLLPKSRQGFKYGDVTLLDHMAYDGLWDAFTDQAMGALTDACNTGPVRVSRADQDAFAARSHQRAEAAAGDGTYARELTDVPVPQRRGRPGPGDPGRGHPVRRDGGVARRAPAGLRQGRHDHRWLVVADLRWRGSAGDRQPGGRRAARADRLGRDRGVRDRGRAGLLAPTAAGQRHRGRGEEAADLGRATST